MKNIPDDGLFDELVNRLQNYSEKPDDQLWDKIVGNAQPLQGRRWGSAPRYAAVFALMGAIVLFLLYRPDSSPEVVVAENKVIAKQKPANQESSQKTKSAEEQGSGKSKTIGQSPVSGSADRPPIDVEKQYLSENADPATKKVTPLNSDPLWQDTENGKPARAGQESVAEVLKATDGLNPAKINSDTIKGQKPLPIDTTKDPEKSQKQKEKKANAGLTFYAMVTPSLSFQKIIPYANDNIIVSKFLSAPVLSANRFGFAFDAGVQGRLSRNWEYYGGFSYYQQTQKFSFQFQSGDSTLIESGSNPLSFTASPGTYTRQVEYDMKNIGLQAGILYQLKGNKLTSKLGAGFSFQHGVTKIRSGETYDNAHSQYLFYQLFYRNELTVFKSVKVFIQPNFSYAIYSHEKLAQPFKLKPYRAGFSVGVLYPI